MSKPRIASFILSAIVGLALFVGLPTAASAQLTCGWCAEWYDANTREYSHQFASSTGGECLWPKPGASHGGTVMCSRCGGDSSCHDTVKPGTCHILCGPAGGLAEAVGEVQRGFEDGNLTLVAGAILRERAAVSVEYVPKAGRIDFVLPCDPTRTVHTIAVLPAVRRALNARIAVRLAAAAR